MGAVTSPAAVPGAARERGLDGLRAIAAIAIIFHHVGFQSGVTTGRDGLSSLWGRYLGRLDIGVPVFFALSGYLLFRPIVVSVLHDRPLRPAAVHFWRRGLRIYPAYWVAILLIVWLTTESFGGITETVTHLLLVHIHWPTDANSPMPQAWSLATEVTFYLALPLFGRVLRPWLADRTWEGRRNGLFAFVAVCGVVSLAFRIWVLGIGSPRWVAALVLWLPANIDYFAIGMGLAVATIAFPVGHRVRGRLDRLAAPAGLWWLLAAAWFHVVSQWMGLALGTDMASWPREIGRQGVYAVIGFCLLFPLVFGTQRRSLVRRFAGSGPMEWLGLISYSIYLWHMVFVVHPWEPLADLLGARRESLLWDYLGTPFWTYMVMVSVPTLVVATVSYYTVERAGLRLQGRLRRPALDPTPVEAWVTRVLARWRAATFRAQLAVIAGVAFAGRVLYVILAKHDQTLATRDIFPGDQFFYTRAADALARGEGFVTPWQDIAVKIGLVAPGTPPAPAADHPPLTAIVASPASFLPGGRGEHLFEQRFLMCAVGAAVVVMIGLLGRELGGRRLGLTAAALAAVYPGFWINDGLVMAESLTTLMVAGALWASVRYHRAPSVRIGLELGGWIGLAALARAESLLLLGLLVLPLLWVTHRSVRTLLGRAALVGAATTVVVAPWVVPNLVRFDEPVVMSHGDGLVLIGANNDAAYHGGGLGFWTPPQRYLDAEARFDDTDPSVDSAAARDEAIDYIRHHLRDQPRVMLARIGRLWSVFRPLQTAALNTQEGREPWASHLAIAGLYLVVPLAAVGWWRLRDRWGRLLVVVMVVHVTVIGALFYGIPRFRVPAEVALVVAAAAGLTWLTSLGACPPPRISSSRPSSSSRSSSSTPSSASGS